jgi:hypothetical protein
MNKSILDLHDMFANCKANFIYSKPTCNLESQPPEFHISLLSGKVQTEKSRSGQMYMTGGQVKNPKPLKQRKAMDISKTST